MIASISETFRNGTVLVTGSTGFLGKILMEKLLRSCHIKNIAVLVRSKKGLAAHQRILDIFEQPLFDRLRKEKPDFMSCIKLVEGDVEGFSIGLTTVDRDWLTENVNFVFHCAATVRFNEPLEKATDINVQGTENVLAFAEEIKNLKGIVYVSTAYSRCPRNDIKEQYYPVPITAMELKNKLRYIDDSTPDIIGNWPNTYTFTKAITENTISTNENHLPISIFRPSIIGCTKSEPEPGWLENMNGPTGLITPIIVGLLRVVPIGMGKKADVIPVDYTANALISVMWDTVNRHQDPEEVNKKPKIYNYVSGVESPLTWGRLLDIVYETYHEQPPLISTWYIFCVYTSNLWLVYILRLFLHRIPAMLMNLLLILNGKSPNMLKMYAKWEYMMDMFNIFMMREWEFENSNTQKLWSMLSQEDRNTFWFSLDRFDWNQYIRAHVYGIRKHILHEDENNLEKALIKNRRLFWLHYASIVLIIYLAVKSIFILL